MPYTLKINVKLNLNKYINNTYINTNFRIYKAFKIAKLSHVLLSSF